MDSNWAGSAADKKNTSGGCYCMGFAMISCFSKKQSNVSLSTIEVEYIATCAACCEVIWIQKLMSGLFDMDLDPTVIICDNQSCIKMKNNPVGYGTKWSY